MDIIGRIQELIEMDRGELITEYCEIKKIKPEDTWNLDQGYLVSQIIGEQYFDLINHYCE